MNTQPTFEEYRQEWTRDVLEGAPSNFELGRRFARKLITQWLDVSETTDDIIYCDGSGDGGIDIAYLHRGEPSDGESEQGTVVGDSWYLVQSKYGNAFRGTTTLLEESVKVIDTLDGQRTNLSSLAQDLLQRLNTFRQQVSDADRLVLVFATEEPLSPAQKRTLDGVRVMGRDRLGTMFDVETVSIDTIYKRVLDELVANDPRIKIPLHGNLVESGKDLLVGAIPLSNLYGFMKAYRASAGDLDRLYEKNVRRFLGSRGKVNKAMQHTLQHMPEQFGLYNNGITIVVENFTGRDGVFQLLEPYIVNGCQTTRTIWEVFHQKTEAGGTGKNASITEWKTRAKQGVVVAKIVKVGSSGDQLLENITRYTNSQNAVREKDFLALTLDFRNLSNQMEDKYNVFLETQRGGWDSRRAYQRQHPDEKQYTEHTNVFDLIKVYGAGWLGEPGIAVSRNVAFLPNGSIFRRIFNPQNADEQFTVEDFYAAYLIQKGADKYKFGRGAEVPSRRQTRFLFYTVIIEILKGVMLFASLDARPKNVTQALIKLFRPDHQAASHALLDVAVEVIDEYMQAGSEESIFKEPPYHALFNNNLVSYIAWDQFTKTDEASPCLRSLLAIHKRAMGRGSPAPRELILNAISH